MFKNKKIIIGIVILLLISSIALLKVRKKPQLALASPTVSVEKGDIFVTVSAVGTIEAQEEQEVFSETSGTITYIAEDGLPVKKGDIILKIENKELQGELERAEYRLMRENAELEKLLKGARDEELKKTEAKLSEAKADYEQALLDFERSQRLFNEGAISKQELETENARLIEKRTLLSLAQSDHSLVKNVDPLEVEIKKASLKEAETDYNNTLKKVDDLIVYAQMDGIILDSKAQEGMMVSQGEKLMTVGDITKLQVSADVNEFDASKLKVGQKVEITGDGFDGNKYDGVVTKIAPAAEIKQNGTQGNTTILNVIVEVLNPDNHIKPGFLANLEIDIDSRENVLLLPLECVVDDGNTKSVTVVKNDKTIKRQIKTGIYDELYIEIIEGLSENDKVLQEPLKEEGEIK